MMQQYWEKHPVLYEVVQIAREGEWVTHVFEWIFMMVSRFAGYLMTLAVGYLIFYAIEAKHSLSAIPVHPVFADQLALVSSAVINVAPELVFPGVVVLCLRGFVFRRWLDASLYLVTAIAFAILTLVLLNAFMNGGIDKDFLAAMLFWRAAAALSYTVVVTYCGGHGGLDLKTLLRELDALRGQLDGGQQTVSNLQEQLSSVQQRATALQEQLDAGQREASRLRRDLDTEQQRVSKLQAELETGEGDVARLRRELNVATVDADALRIQLEGKQRELVGLRETLENGQEWQESRFRQLLEVEQHRASSLQEQLTGEQAAAAALRRQLNTALIDVDGLRKQLEHLSGEQAAAAALRRQLQTALGEANGLRQELEAKQREVGQVQELLEGQQREVSSLREMVEAEQRRASTLQHRLDSIQVSSEQHKMNTGQEKKVGGGQGKVVQLDTSRSRKGGQDESAIAEQIRALLAAEPGLSGRKIAERIGCSPTTAAKWKTVVEGESTECVNE